MAIGKCPTSFNRVYYRHLDESIFLYAFELIELDGDDLRCHSLERRKARLEMVLAEATLVSTSMTTSTKTASTVFRHACHLGFGGIVSSAKTAVARSTASNSLIRSLEP